MLLKFCTIVLVENSPAGMASREVHSLKHLSNEVAFVLAANRFAGIVVSMEQLEKVYLKSAAFGPYENTPAGTEVILEHPLKQDPNVFAPGTLANTFSGMERRLVHP